MNTKQGSTNNNMLFLRWSRFVISPGHGCTEWNVAWFFTAPSVRIVPQILSWPLQYSFQFILDQLSYIVWGTNSIIKCTINTRELPTYTTVRNEIRNSFAENQILPHSHSKNGSAGRFPGFESAVVEWFNLYWWCKITEFSLRFHCSYCRVFLQYF